MFKLALELLGLLVILVFLTALVYCLAVVLGSFLIMIGVI